MTRKDPTRRRLGLGGAAVAAAGLLAAGPAASSDVGSSAGAGERCSPVPAHRPVCEVGEGGIATAAFVDPTSAVRGARRVSLAESAFVGPFSRLDGARARVRIGPESNVQDNVEVIGATRSSAARNTRLARAGLRPRSGVATGERVILAHGSAVHGPARLGVGPVLDVEDGSGGTTEDSGVFVSFGAVVDGAVVERDAGLSTFARVGPGVRLRSGFIVLPGKDVVTQAQADDPALGKVRPITAADREFNAGVVEVNVGLAREYSRFARESLSNVRGLGADPGGNAFDQARDLPTVGSDLCTGPEVRRPGFRNRVIGDVCFEDTFAGLDAAMGERISLRADEGGPFGVGTIDRMGDDVIFHALESNDLSVGHRVRYGEKAIVHGGGRPQIDPTTGLAAPTLVGNDVRLGDEAIVFRSLVRNRAVIGRRSVVVGSELAVGQRIAPRTVYANDEVFGRVEW